MLLEKLATEIEAYQSWRFQLIDLMGRIVFDESPELREDHRQYIRNSHYYQIVQEAPFCWRIMNKPEGYAGDA